MTVSGVIGEFGIRALIGLGAVLPVIPSQEVDPWYFRTQALVALGCAVLLGLASGGWFPWLAVLLAWLAFVFWTLGRSAWGRTCFALVAGCGLAELVTGTSGLSASEWLVGIDYVLSSAFVASVYSAMILGHWYLVWPWMSTKPLKRTIAISAAALAGRGLWWIAWTASRGALQAAVHDDQLRLLVVAQAGVGFLGVGVGLFLAYRCTQIRSTQSATGILYAATVMALLGELAGARLVDELSGPSTPVSRRITSTSASGERLCRIHRDLIAASTRPTRVRSVVAALLFRTRVRGPLTVQFVATMRSGTRMLLQKGGSVLVLCVAAKTCMSARTSPTHGVWRSSWLASSLARSFGSTTTTFTPWLSSSLLR